VPRHAIARACIICGRRGAPPRLAPQVEALQAQEQRLLEEGHSRVHADFQVRERAGGRRLQSVNRATGCTAPAAAHRAPAPPAHGPRCLAVEGGGGRKREGGREQTAEHTRCVLGVVFARLAEGGGGGAPLSLRAVWLDVDTCVHRGQGGLDRDHYYGLLLLSIIVAAKEHGREFRRDSNNTIHINTHTHT
jgi:hypothetical protein